MRPRLLVVPHIYADDLRIREIEFAKRLLSSFDVSCLKWHDALHVEAPNPFYRRWRQLSTAVRGLVREFSWRRDDTGMTLFEMPILQAILLRRFIGDERAASVSRAFNTPRLEKLIARFGITHLLLACDHFDLPSSPGLRTFFDIVDWFPEETHSPRQKALRTYATRLRDSASGIFAVSEPLAERLRNDYAMDSIPIPNGADLAALRNVEPADVKAVRNRWGVADKYVIGYIGNHGSFTGVDFLVETYRTVRQRIPNAALLIIGPADYWVQKVDSHLPGVVFTGPIPPAQIANYFQAVDLGVLAQDKSLGTEFAFQIKVVEYTACRKFVISTPLLVWQRLKWPNVRLVELNVTAWANAICELKNATWSPEWDALTEPYDWSALANKMAITMLGDDRHEANP